MRAPRRRLEWPAMDKDGAMAAGRGLDIADIWTPAEGLPPRAVLQEIARRCGQLWEIPSLNLRVGIHYNRRMRTALGRAMLREGRVELNVRLLLEHPEELIPTLVHELAHVAAHLRFGRVEPHGPHWRSLMTAAGMRPSATHRLPVAHLRRAYLYLHRCSGCGRVFVFRRPMRHCYCKACGPDMNWEILRVTDNEEGRKLVAEFKATGMAWNQG